MFWKKKKHFDSQLGELVYNDGAWSGSTSNEKYENILLDIEGSKDHPDDIALTQAKDLLRQINKYILLAKDFILAQDLEHFINGNGHIIFDGFYSSKVPGILDLQFGISNWDDAVIIVHFKEGNPQEISLGD